MTLGTEHFMSLRRWKKEVMLERVVSIAKTSEELEEVRLLMRAFIAWHKERHSDDLTLIDAYFDQAEFEAELASLPGKCSPPDGQLLLDTSVRQKEAQRLYSNHGFLPTESYYDVSADLKKWLVFMKLPL